MARGDGLGAVRKEFGPEVEEYIRTLPDRAWRRAVAMYADLDVAREWIRDARVTLAKAKGNPSYALALAGNIVVESEDGSSLVGIPSVRSLVISQMEADWYRTDEEAQRHMGRALALEKQGMPDTSVPYMEHRSVDQLSDQDSRLGELVGEVAAKEEQESKPYRATLLRIMGRQLAAQEEELAQRTARG